MTMLEKAARAAATKLQFRDFGHEDENGDWHMTAAQIVDFELACSEIARAVLAVFMAAEPTTRLRAQLAEFDAEVAAELGAECERADLWTEIEVNVDDLRAILEGESK